MNLLGLRSVAKKQPHASARGEDHTLSPRLPSEARANVPWQVFGLYRFNPTRRTSQSVAAPVSSWAFVPAHRCGAVPDFHRIPFSSSARRNRGMKPPYLAPIIHAIPLLVDISPQGKNRVADNSPLRAATSDVLKHLPEAATGKRKDLRNERGRPPLRSWRACSRHE
jgi:hypothetical protein